MVRLGAKSTVFEWQRIGRSWNRILRCERESDSWQGATGFEVKDVVGFWRHEIWLLLNMC